MFVRVVRLLFAIEQRMALEAVRCAQPALGNDRVVRLFAGAALGLGLGHHFGKFHQHVGIGAGRREMNEEGRAARDLDVAFERRRRVGNDGAHRIGAIRSDRYDAQRPIRLRIGIGGRVALGRGLRRGQRTIVE